MTVLGHLLLTLARVLGFLIDLYTLLVGLSVLMSWVRPDPSSPIVRFLYQVTEPSFRLARRLIPRRWVYKTGFDLSPLLVFILLILLDSFLVGLLTDAGRSLLSR